MACCLLGILRYYSQQLSQDQFLYLTTTGWKTGRKHEIETWFVEHKKKYYIMSEGRERAHWVQNIIHDPAVSFSVGGKNFAGTGRVVVVDDDGKEEPLVAEIKRLMKSKYRWDSGMIVELAPS